MRRLLARLAAEVDHTRRAHYLARQIVAGYRAYWAPNAPLAEQADAAEQVAERLERQARHLEASALARRVARLPAPHVLRSEALGWRRRAAYRRIEDPR